MRCVRVTPLLVATSLAMTGAGYAQGARQIIDPAPNSLSLSQLLDRQSRQQARAEAKAPSRKKAPVPVAENRPVPSEQPAPATSDAPRARLAPKVASLATPVGHRRTREIELPVKATAFPLRFVASLPASILPDRDSQLMTGTIGAAPPDPVDAALLPPAPDLPVPPLRTGLMATTANRVAAAETSATPPAPGAAHERAPSTPASADPAIAPPPVRSEPPAASPPAKVRSIFPPEPKAVPKIPSPKPAEAPSTAAAPAEAAFVYVVDQDLRSFLNDLARRFGMRADIASGVRGRLAQTRLPAGPRELLRELASRFEIEWTIEGEVLKVSSRSELVTRILPLGSVSLQDWIRNLNAAGLDTERYAPTPMPGSQSVILTAPVSHLARAVAILDTLKTGREASSDMKIIRAGVTHKVVFE
jgi:hypothetical protein